MQTFLPYEVFQRSAEVLDRQRLGKQRIDAKQLLRILSGEGTGKGWRNHPAVLMWRGHELMLARYGMAICLEWRKRGYKDQQLEVFHHYAWRLRREEKKPWWLGKGAFHLSHQSNLLRKDPEYYSQFGWAVSPDLPYVWPVRKS
jgi:hypothetical protein